MGIGIFLKNFLPVTIYLAGIVFFSLSVVGRTRWALFLAIFLVPLRNFVEKIQLFPLGDQFVDILIIGVIIGQLFKSNKESPDLKNSSSTNLIVIISVFYLVFSLEWGSLYLHGSLNFNIHDTSIQDCKNFILMPLIYFLTIKNLGKKNDVWLVIGIMCVSILISIYYTAYQISMYSSLISRSKISGTFQFLGPNEVAAYLNTYTIILISIFYSVKKFKFKASLAFLIIASLFCILFVYSRGAYIALIFGLMIFFAIKDKKLLILLILLICFWNVILPEKVIERILETKSENGEFDGSTQGRIEMWRNGIDIFKSSPIFGIGFGSFRHMGFNLKDTHNIYIKILTEQGLIGIILFLLTAFFFLREGILLYQKGEDEISKALGFGFFCAIFVVLINNFFGDRWSYLEPNAYLWIFAALVVRLNATTKGPETLKSEIKTGSTSGGIPQKFKKKLRYYDI